MEELLYSDIGFFLLVIGGGFAAYWFYKITFNWARHGDCPKCGKNVPIDLGHCEKCGKKVRWTPRDDK